MNLKKVFFCVPEYSSRRFNYALLPIKVLYGLLQYFIKRFFFFFTICQGIFDHVFLGDQALGPWKMTAYPLNETAWLSSIEPVESVQLPAFFRTQFTLPTNDTNCYDTYLDTSGWTKASLERFYWTLSIDRLRFFIKHTRRLLFAGRGVSERDKPGPVLAARRPSSDPVRARHVFGAAAGRQHARDVRTRGRAPGLDGQVGRQAHPRWSR